MDVKQAAECSGAEPVRGVGGGGGAGQGDGLSPGMVTLPHTCVTLSRGPAPPTSETYKKEKQEPNELPAVAQAPRLAGLMA